MKLERGLFNGSNVLGGRLGALVIILIKKMSYSGRAYK